MLGEEVRVMKARLLLVQAAGTVLSTALELLGVSAPARM
ncbi:MAG TPA: DALR anticodon-binding domain-containing protein [Synergistales bacterium]|nr:DALR anticodon-binding domain-containing protein [Synergistales bacterium]